MKPLFKLSIGNAGSSFAVEIARKIGLPADIIAGAEEIVGSDYINLDKYLLDIARDKRYWENKRNSIKAKEKKSRACLRITKTEPPSSVKNVVKLSTTLAVRPSAYSEAQTPLSNVQSTTSRKPMPKKKPLSRPARG